MSCEELKKVLEADTYDDCFANATSANEGGKKFSFVNVNRKTICRVHIDNCLITNNTVKKCDYLFNVSEDDTYYLVEFKGTAVDDAVEQIVSTFEIINGKLQKNPQNYSGVIVSSSVPAGTEQKFRRLQEKCYKEKHLKITKTHFQHIERI